MYTSKPWEYITMQTPPRLKAEKYNIRISPEIALVCLPNIPASFPTFFMIIFCLFWYLYSEIWTHSKTSCCCSLYLFFKIYFADSIVFLKYFIIPVSILLLIDYIQFLDVFHVFQMSFAAICMHIFKFRR